MFIARTIPILFPNDAISFAAGLTSMRLRDYVIISFFGYIPSTFLLTFFGGQLSYNLNPFILVILSIIGFGICGYLFRHPIKVFFIKEIRDFENEIKTLEEKSLKEIKIIEKEISYDYNKIKNKGRIS